MKKILLNHPITHSGQEFSRGVHELEDGLADKFLAMENSPAVPFANAAPQLGVVQPAPDAKSPEEENEEEEGNEATGDAEATKALAAELYHNGATVEEVATQLNISKRAAKKLKP